MVDGASAMPLSPIRGCKPRVAVMGNRKPKLREDEKERKYRNSCPQGTEFIPLVMESYGRWGARAREIFEVCTDKIATSRGSPKSLVVTYWRQRFAITLQKYTAACIQERWHTAVVRESALWADASERVNYTDMAFVR